MNRWSFLLLGVATSLVASANAAPAPNLKSTLIVNVLSVDREEVRRHGYRRESFKSGERSSGWEENTTNIAKARVETVLNSEFDLSPGAVIEFRYFTFGGSDRPDKPAPLKAGDTRTLTLFRGETSLWWRGEAVPPPAGSR
jgi:hypothetical protein